MKKILTIVFMVLASFISRAQINTWFTADINPNNGSVIFYAYDYTFMNDTVVNAVSYFWNFGDGTTSNYGNPIHTYTSSGPFIVCLTVHNNLNGDSGSYCDTVHLNTLHSSCNALFYYLLDSTDANGAWLSFYNLSTPDSGSTITTIYWLAGVNNPFNQIQINPGSNYFSYPFPKTVIDSFYLTIYTSSGCMSWVQTPIYDIAKTNTTVQPPCHASFTYSIDSLNGKVNFTASAGTTDSSAYPINYIWNFGDGASATTNNDTISHIYNSSGYTACLTIQTANGCSSTYCDSIIENPNPTCQAAFYSMVDSSNTSTTTFSFINYSYPDGNSTITMNLWNFGDGTSSTVQNPVHTFSSGLHYVCLTIVTSDSCSSTYCDSIYVNTNPCNLFANIVAISPTTIGGHDGHIESNVYGGNPPYTYYWSNGATTPNIYNLTSGTYYLNVVDSTGCQNTFYATLYEPYDTTGGPIVDTLYTNIIDTCLNFVPDSFYIASISVDTITHTVNVVWTFTDNGQSESITTTYTYDIYGNTMVVITLSCGTKTLITYQSYINIRSTLSAPSLENSMNFTAYPVPFSDKLHVRFIVQKAGYVNIQLTDVSGRMIFSKIITAQSGINTDEINTSSLHSGMYILNIISGNDIIRRQVVK